VNRNDTKSSGGETSWRSRLRSVSVVSASTMLSRVLGMARDMLQTHFLASAVFDAFDVAYTFPNLFRRLFGEGALSAAFIPVFKEELETGERGSATRLANATFTLLAIVLGAIVMVCYAVALFLQKACPQYKQSDTLFGLLYVMLPYLLFICLAALLGAILNSLHHFATPVLMPVLLNVCMIAALIFLVPARPGVYGLAAAVLIAGMLQVLVQSFVLRRRGIQLAPCFAFRQPQIKKMMLLMLPVIAGLAVMQVNVMFDRLIAYILVPRDGANKVLYIGNRLMQLPLGVFGIAIATVVFPEMAGCAARGDDEGFLESLRHGLRLVCFACIPAGVGLIVVGKPIIQLLFEHGRFVADDTFRATRVLVLYSIGLWAFSAVHVVVRAFYSLQDMKTPVQIAVGIVLLNLGLNLLLVRTPLQESGLALATSICSAVNLLLLLRILAVRKGGVAAGDVAKSAAKVLAACVPMALVCLFLLRILPSGMDLRTRLARVLVPTAGGGFAFFIACWALRVRELRELFSALSGKRASGGAAS